MWIEVLPELTLLVSKYYISNYPESSPCISHCYSHFHDIILIQFYRILMLVYISHLESFSISTVSIIHVKAVPLQAWSGPEGSRKLRFPDFMTSQDGGKIVNLTHRPPLPQEMHLVLSSIRGWVDPRVIVRSEASYINEKFQWHQLGSNQRPSDL